MLEYRNIILYILMITQLELMMINSRNEVDYRFLNNKLCHLFNSLVKKISLNTF